ncbi:secretory protein [Chitinophaga agrisoli]|uniref:Secretory protein n=1 Tax=Chitinophaga agrisoli TaxID=2607653 RepID=A0A5B2VYS5_9BACT|nr:basic secretory protein-like protein [Chitinophaga agrisoli]KAA2244581.1 secretory protein [Chitinophaga agrisoli]
MKKLLTGAAALLLLMANKPALHAQADFMTADTIRQGGYTLVFINKDASFDKNVKQRMQDAFFTVYPRLAKTYNKRTLKTVTFMIDPAYDGVAATGNGVVRYNPEWLHKHPGDIDVVTHEVMHIVQAYPDSKGPGWLTEGIADYVRYVFGVDNKGAGWALPAYAPSQTYEQSYRVVARFLVWVENANRGAVKKLDATMRAGNYTPDIWQKTTGKTLDELWSSYGAHPEI